MALLPHAVAPSTAFAAPLALRIFTGYKEKVGWHRCNVGASNSRDRATLEISGRRSSASVQAAPAVAVLVAHGSHKRSYLRADAPCEPSPKRRRRSPRSGSCHLVYLIRS